MNQQKILHVVHLTTDSAIGGTERMILATAEGLSKQRFRSTVVTLCGGGVLEQFCAEKGIAYRSVNMKSKKDFFAVFRLYKILKDLRADILHTYLFHANTLGRVVGKFLGIPVILSGQRNVDIWRRWYHNLIDRLTTRFCSVIISNSNAGKIFLHQEVGIPEHKIDVVQNGVFLPEVAQSSSSDLFTILNVASLTEKKGQEYLITAFSRLREDGISAKLVIVGDGPQRAYLEDCVVTAKISDMVEFLGFQESVDAYLRNCDVFVLPSLWEGLPVALMEAMAYGKPCIATRVGGIPELITDGVDGVLLEPKNPLALYESLLRLYKDDALRLVLGKAAREKIKTQFTMDTMIASIERIYSTLHKEILK